MCDEGLLQLDADIRPECLADEVDGLLQGRLESGKVDCAVLRRPFRITDRPRKRLDIPETEMVHDAGEGE